MRSGMRKFRKSHLVFAVYVFLAVCCFLLDIPGQTQAAEETGSADYNQYQRRVFNIDSTLHCEKTTAVADTEDGRLWIGTYDGLFSFDGVNFEQIDLGPVHAVNALYTDEEDNLWVGTNDNGITVVRDGKVMSVIRKENGLPSNIVHVLTGDSDGHILAGTGSGTVELSLSEDQDGESSITVGARIANVDQASGLASGQSHLAAAVGEDGFLTLIRNDEAWDVVLPDEEYSYTSVSFSEENQLYAGRDDGNIDRFDPSGDSLQKTETIDTGSGSAVNSILFSDGTLFACTENGIYYQAEDGFCQISSSLNGSVTGMEKDFQGNLWFISPRIGLMELYHSPAVDLFQSAGLDETVVNTEMEWQGLLYFGTDQGIECIDPLTSRPAESRLADSLSGVPVQCLFKDSEGTLSWRLRQVSTWSI